MSEEETVKQQKPESKFEKKGTKIGDRDKENLQQI